MDLGLKILLNTYWGSNGWKNGEITEDDFTIAKNEGYMFDYPEYEKHDNVLYYSKNIADSIKKEDVANAFLFSLSTRKLEYRSALASYYYIKSIPLHHIKEGTTHCEFCGWYSFDKDPSKYELRHGYNVLNFERHKWGGVRHDQLAYAKFDLEQFCKLPKVIPIEEDLIIFFNILNVISKLDVKSKSGKYAKQIIKDKILRSNKSEIDILLSILGMCDIFNSKEAKGYLHSFTPDDSSRDPIEHTNDYHFPVNCWHVYDGINKEALLEVFNIIYN